MIPLAASRLMNPAEKELQLVARFSIIEDLHERLAAVTERARKLPTLADAEKIDAHRVQGCVSRVWLVGSMEGGRCRFRLDADSALVKGLAALLCEVFDDGEARDIVHFESTVLNALRLSENLSPTRRQGLSQVQRAMREFAAGALAKNLP